MNQNLIIKNDFAAFILSHGRPDNVITYETLKRSGYTGKIYIIVDDMDKTYDRYIENFGDIVIKFDKKAIAKTFDRGDNFNDYRSTSYVRNAMWDIAKNLGLKYFIQLDDDYTNFAFRFNKNIEYIYQKNTGKLDDILKIFLEYFINTKNILSICLAQGGDYIGGPKAVWGQKIRLRRKAMNSFICSVDRHFQFLGRLNEDVNTYLSHGSKGKLFFTHNLCYLNQKATQQNSGGMTDIYMDMGTYNKSFSSVIYQPSSVKVKFLYGRIHHSINWKYTVPKILREDVKKKKLTAPAI